MFPGRTGCKETAEKSEDDRKVEADGDEAPAKEQSQVAPNVPDEVTPVIVEMLDYLPAEGAVRLQVDLGHPVLQPEYLLPKRL